MLSAKLHLKQAAKTQHDCISHTPLTKSMTPYTTQSLLKICIVVGKMGEGEIPKAECKIFLNLTSKNINVWASFT